MKLQLIAKYEKKIEGEIFKKFQKIVKEQCHSAEKCKRGEGPFGIFLTSIVLQNIETNEEETLWCNPKNFEKVA